MQSARSANEPYKDQNGFVLDFVGADRRADRKLIRVHPKTLHFGFTLSAVSIQLSVKVF
jgi:hypothetical protein